MIQDVYADPRFKFIGDLPTGCFLYKWKELYIRPFDVIELPLLSLGANARYNGVSHLLRAVDIVMNQPVTDLTDGDFEFVLGWLRKFSFPSTPLVVQWPCTKRVFAYPEGALYIDEENPEPDYKRQRELKLKPIECNTNNTEIVHGVKTVIDTLDDDWTNDDPELDLPRMLTYSDYYEYTRANPGNKLFGQVARHIKAGDTFHDKLAILSADTAEAMDLYERAWALMQRSVHGIREQMTLRCRSCETRVPFTAYPDYRAFFPESSEQEISDVQYNLMARFHTAPNDRTSSLKLLYHHSCLVRDIKEEQQQRQAQQSARRSGRR